MNCPNCNTVNDPASQFCINCGQTLPRTGSMSPAARPLAHSQRQLLGIVTGRFVIGLLLIWLLRGIVVNLSFVEGLRIPEVPFTAAEMLTFIAYVIILVLLFGYLQSLRALWPRAFPRAVAVLPALTAVIYVIALSAIYTVLTPLIINLVDDPADLLLALRFILLILALALLGWAGKIIYDALPDWLRSIRFAVPSGGEAEVACLYCGRLNPGSLTFCGYCGHSLSGQNEAASQPD